MVMLDKPKRRAAQSSVPAFDPVERVTVTEQVYRRLKDGLMTGRFAPGQKVAIRGLADALGASPMPIREALHRLQAEGAIEITQTGRIRIVSLTLEQLRDVRDARMALEGMLGERAAARVTSDDMAEIVAAYEAMETSVGSGDREGYLASNFAFHRRIYFVADCRITQRVVESLWLLMGPCFFLLTPDGSHLARSMEAHRAIRDALAAGDGPAARAAVCDDIMQAAASLSLLLAKTKEG